MYSFDKCMAIREEIREEIKASPRLTDYAMRLRHHDWYFGHSDDMQVFRAGKLSWEHLYEEAKFSEIKQFLLDLSAAYHFGPGTSFNHKFMPSGEHACNFAFARHQLIGLEVFYL